jgi:hypothetical protein
VSVCRKLEQLTISAAVAISVDDAAFEITQQLP